MPDQNPQKPPKHMALSKTLILPIVTVVVMKLVEPSILKQITDISPNFYEVLTYALMMIGAGIGRWFAGGVWILKRPKGD